VVHRKRSPPAEAVGQGGPPHQLHHLALQHLHCQWIHYRCGVCVCVCVVCIGCIYRNLKFPFTITHAYTHIHAHTHTHTHLQLTRAHTQSHTHKVTHPHTRVHRHLVCQLYPCDTTHYAGALLPVPLDEQQRAKAEHPPVHQAAQLLALPV